MLQVNEIEDAILATLQNDATLSAYVRTFAILPSLDEASLEKVLKIFPAIGIIGTDGAYSYATSNVQQDTGTFLVLCFNRNLRSSIASMRGGISGETGVWDMIDDCRSALLPGALTGITVMDCLARRRELLFAGDKWAAASLEVEVKWRNI